MPISSWSLTTLRVNVWLLAVLHSFFLCIGEDIKVPKAGLGNNLDKVRLMELK